MSSAINLKGKKFAKLTVISRAENTKDGKTRWLCLCDCNSEKVIMGRSLRNGDTGSCGCLSIKHSMSKDPEYIAWKAMKARCYNVKKENYHKYGGRGIRVCEWWLNSFENFFSDMGSRPSKNHTVDRINNDGNYEPANCRWATKSGQSQNQGLRSTNTSGAKGVAETKSGKYIARISFNSRELHLGTFNTFDEAVKAYDEATLVHHGEYAKPNNDLNGAQDVGKVRVTVQQQRQGPPGP